MSVLLSGCSSNPAEEKTPAAQTPPAASPEADKAAIAATLDSLNATAARADHGAYFALYSDDATFIGTDATENWDKPSFMAWAKPYFDRGKAWDFSVLERNIYLDPSGSWAWFDELLNTQMKLCRGSGVMVKQDSTWKIRQYVLSMTFPNQRIDEVVALKSGVEDSLIVQMKGTQQ